MSADPAPEFLTPKQAASVAGLSTRAIYRAIERGELEAVRLCSRLRIRCSAFDEWIERKTVPSRAPVARARPVRTEVGSFRQLLAQERRRP